MRYYTIYSYNVRIKLKFTVTLYNVLVEIDNAFYTLNVKNSVIHFIYYKAVESHSLTDDKC